MSITSQMIEAKIHNAENIIRRIERGEMRRKDGSPLKEPRHCIRGLQSQIVAFEIELFTASL